MFSLDVERKGFLGSVCLDLTDEIKLKMDSDKLELKTINDVIEKYYDGLYPIYYVQNIYDASENITEFCFLLHYTMLHEYLHIIFLKFEMGCDFSCNEELIDYFCKNMCLLECLMFKEDGVLTFPYSLLDLLKDELGNDDEKKLELYKK